MTTVSGTSLGVNTTNGVANYGTQYVNDTTPPPPPPKKDQEPTTQPQPQQQQQQQEQKEEPPLSDVIANIHHRIQTFLAETHPPDSPLAAVQRQTRITLDVFATALTQYPLSELSLSYNGGKDCLVLLVLFLASLHPHPSPENGGLASIPAIYALPPDPFPAVEDFVLSSARAYHLSIVKYTTDPPRSTLRSSFEDYLNLNPGVKAIFVGTRRTDPHGANLTHFDRTDSGWPNFVRIHPVIDWHYAEIWTFICHLGFEYCLLYDQGYTSLGGTTDTHPNPRLRIDGQSQNGEALQPATSEKHYRPAYELTEDVEERLGRN